MRMVAIVFVVLLGACVSRPASAADLAAIYLNKQFWQQMNWENAESSTLWQMDGWHPYMGKQSDYATFVKRQTLTLLGQQVDANIAYENNVQTDQHFTTAS